MVISHLIGGLGNQMFQFAAGRALSLSRDRSFRLDVQDFAGYALHNGYELNRVFGVDIPLVAVDELRSVLSWRAHSLVRRQLYYRSFLKKIRGEHFVVDTQFSTWEQINSVPDDVYLMGNWQTEKYFESCQDMIRSDFSFQSVLSARNAEVASLIAKSESVSLHVRRGDIASNPSSLAFHGLCSLSYYNQAIEYIRERVVNPVFFIFSDDMPWVEEHFRLNDLCYFIDHNSGLDSYNDLRLMALCQHNIIANSSFSWWGAWLNAHANKIIIAPKHWVVADFDTTDLIPDSWVIL